MARGNKPPEVVSDSLPPRPSEIGEEKSRASISYSEVRKIYEGGDAPVAALGPISLKIGSGDFVSIIGPSGCGKSTLLRMTAGLVRPTTGMIVMAGQQVQKTRVDIGFIFQDPVLLPWKKILANVLFQIEMRGLRPADYVDRARELIDLVGLTGFEGRYPSELSGGMQQRASLCRALIHDPSVLLMDEPFAALDAMTRDQMNTELLQIWRRTKKTVLLVTHSIAEAVYLSNRVLVMSPRPGQIVLDLPIHFDSERSGDIRDSVEFLDYTRRLRSAIGK